MSALQEYLAVARRQYEFLERVLGLDDRMAEMERPLERDHRGRIHWTRQDGNYAAHRLAVDRIWAKNHLTSEEKGSAQCDLPVLRQRRRICSAVRWCRQGLADAKSAALTEAGKLGGFDTLAPRIVELYSAHDHLCANYAREINEHEIDWHEAERRHAEAVSHLSDYVIIANLGPAVPIVQQPALPVVTLKASGADIYFDGATDNDVDLTAAECLQQLISKFPHATGIGHLCGGQPARAIGKLPKRIRGLCKSDGPGKGYRFEP